MVNIPMEYYFMHQWRIVSGKTYDYVESILMEYYIIYNFFQWNIISKMRMDNVKSNY